MPATTEGDGEFVCPTGLAVAVTTLVLTGMA
jgi:hypothetical protein